MYAPDVTQVGYPGGMTELEKGPQGGGRRPGRARAHPQRGTAAVPRSGHQPHRHGPALRGGPGVQAHGIPALHRQGRARRRIPAPVRSRRHGQGDCSTAPTSRPANDSSLPSRCLRPGCALSSRRPSKSTTLSTPHPNTHAATRKPSPRGSAETAREGHARAPTPEQARRTTGAAPRWRLGPHPGPQHRHLPYRRRHRRRPDRQRHPHGSPGERPRKYQVCSCSGGR